MMPLAGLLLVSLAQASQEAVRPYVAASGPVVALTHVRVVDGTAAAPAED